MLNQTEEKEPTTANLINMSPVEEVEVNPHHLARDEEGLPSEDPEEVSPLELLMQKAQQQGYLITDDLLSAIPEAEDNMDQLEEVFIQFVNLGIEIYSDAEEAEEEKKRIEAAKKEEKLDLEVDPFDLSAIAADDTISLYLKEILKVIFKSTTEITNSCRPLLRSLHCCHHHCHFPLECLCSACCY